MGKYSLNDRLGKRIEVVCPGAYYRGKLLSINDWGVVLDAFDTKESRVVGIPFAAILTMYWDKPKPGAPETIEAIYEKFEKKDDDMGGT